MPCNAVATARAKVANESIQKLLTAQVITPLVQQYLKNLYPALEVKASPYGLNTVEFFVDGYRITIAGGEVSVQSSYHSYSQCDAMAGKVRDFLQMAGGALLQQQIRNKLATLGEITEQQTAGNGALVLRMRL